MVANAINPNLWEGEVARWLPVQGQHGLHIEFQSRQGYPISKRLDRARNLYPLDMNIKSHDKQSSLIHICFVTDRTGAIQIYYFTIKILSQLYKKFP